MGCPGVGGRVENCLVIPPIGCSFFGTLGFDDSKSFETTCWMRLSVSKSACKSCPWSTIIGFVDERMLTC
jgi:hypothetical protein